MKNLRVGYFWVAFVMIFISDINLFSQQVTVPRVSPHQKVTHRIGLTDISIDYHSPSVQGRQIWGGIVPYGMSAGVAFGSGNAFPWRAGANENTVINFTDEVKINGNILPAGSYGLHMVPGEKEFIVIFSKNYSSWGSFFYDDKEDVLRITVKPLDAPFREWLVYEFDSYKPNSAELYLWWEKLKIPFTIEVDVNKVVVDNFRKELRSVPGFGWQGLNQAANWCVQNNVNLDEALIWIDRAIPRINNFAVKETKVRILDRLGKTKESEVILKEAIESSNEAELNAYGYQLIGQNKIDAAIEMFRLNVKRFPGSWNVYDSLAEGLQRKGETKTAKEYYEKALKMAPENQHERIKTAINKL